MKLKTLYIGIGLVNVFLLPAYGMLVEEGRDSFHIFPKPIVEKESTIRNGIRAPHKTDQSEEVENNPNCHLVESKMSEVEKILLSYEERDTQIPASEIQRYKSYLEELSDLYNKAKQNKQMNARQELYFITNKYF